MPFCKVNSGTVYGIEAELIQVEINIDYRGFPSFTIVGLPAKEIEESKERVRSAIKNSGIHFPDGRITVNLAPADISKRGSLYDLPIAMGILYASGKINSSIDNYFIFGELSLNGEINHVKGGVPLLELSDKLELRAIIPFNNSIDGKFFSKKIEILPSKSLKQIVGFFNNMENLEALSSLDDYSKAEQIVFNTNGTNYFSQIKQMEFAKRALVIAAAGRHNIALFGPPGSGKSMLSRSLLELLPNPNKSDYYQIAKIRSSVGMEIDNIPSPPFRTPHHSISKVGLVGGGNPILPGEITLSHKGILFLDEFTEFSRECIDSLRQPLENKTITIARSSGRVTFPSDFLLVVAYNLCPCGYYGHTKHECTCTNLQIKKYLSRISGPISERIDLQVFCDPLNMSEFNIMADSELKNDEVEEFILNAIELQKKRYNSKPIQNSSASHEEIKNSFRVERAAHDFLRSVSNRLGFSARTFIKSLKIARTIADLEGNSSVSEKHIAEAVQYRKSPLLN